jgi:hypothetical protein
VLPNLALLFILMFTNFAYAAPPILFMGAFFPVWLAAMVIALPITFLLIAVLIKLNLSRSLQPRGLVYLALYAIVCVAVWLFAFS